MNRLLSRALRFLSLRLGPGLGPGLGLSLGLSLSLSLSLGLGLSLGLALVSSAALANGFSHGERFSTHTSRGFVYGVCVVNDTLRPYQYFCAQNEFSAPEFQYFETDAPYEANNITVTSTWPNGTQVKKTSPYDKNAKRSTKKFSLWPYSLFSKSLLRPGENQISYELRNDDTVVASGEFSAVVERGPDRNCPSYNNGIDFSWNCWHPSDLCFQYFRKVSDYCVP